MNGQSFKELYDAVPSVYEEETPKKAFIGRIARATCRKEMTVRMWLSGRQEPDDLAKRAISQELGVPVEQLFPRRS